MINLIKLDDKYTMDAGKFAPASAVLEEEDNRAGKLTLVVLPDNPLYDVISLHSSTAHVYIDDRWEWGGIAETISTDFWNRKIITFEGILTFLSKTIIRSLYYEDISLFQYISYVLDAYNADCDPEKQIQIGTITGTLAGLTLNVFYQTPLDVLMNLIKEIGGIFHVVRVNEGGTNVYKLDYITENYYRRDHRTHEVMIGENLMDLTKDLQSDDICTAVIPLGAKTGMKDIAGNELRLTISAVNNGKDYLLSDTAKFYGTIWRVVTFDALTSAATLMRAGMEYLESHDTGEMTIEAQAIDADIGLQTSAGFKWRDTVHVQSPPHGVDRSFDITKIKLDILHPAQTQLTLGSTTRLSIAEQVASIKRGE